MLIGIDLGTTNSLAACFRQGRVELIPNRLGEALTPSVVSVDSQGKLYVGKSAKERALLYPEESASVFKRAMGTPREYRLGNRQFRPEDLSSLVLRSLKEDAEAFLGEPVTEAIISVPAYFNDHQRKATKRAGEMAGLKVARIINEPTAAAIACGMAERKDVRYMVLDLGGGTFDVSLLELYGSVMEVRAIAGDNFLGGEDFTEALIGIFLEKTGLSREDLGPKARAELYRNAEACKCAFVHSPELIMCCVLDGQSYAVGITEAMYEKACAGLLERIRQPVERALRDGDVTLEELDEVILVGGATRLPLIRRFVAKLFQKLPLVRVDPDRAVVMGAAIQCAMKSRNREIRELVLTDVCPFTLGTEVTVDNGLFSESGHYLPIVERNTVIPVSRTQRVCTAHDDQVMVRVKILQGESRTAEKNLLLGELSVPVPKGPKGQESVDITYTYDVNALLEVEVTVLSTGIKRKMLIRGSGNSLTEEEARQRMEELAHLKQDPREEEPNRLLLLRGERLYAQSLGEQREAIDRSLLEFERVLKKQNRGKIYAAREALKAFLDTIEPDNE